MKKKRFYGYGYYFDVDYYFIAVDDLLDIHKYLMEKYCKVKMKCLGL